MVAVERRCPYAELSRLRLAKQSSKTSLLARTCGKGDAYLSPTAGGPQSSPQRSPIRTNCRSPTRRWRLCSASRLDESLEAFAGRPVEEPFAYLVWTRDTRRCARAVKWPTAKAVHRGRTSLSICRRRRSCRPSLGHPTGPVQGQPSVCGRLCIEPRRISGVPLCSCHRRWRPRWNSPLSQLRHATEGSGGCLLVRRPGRRVRLREMSTSSQGASL
jgi:hypothetical protein